MCRECVEHDGWLEPEEVAEALKIGKQLFAMEFSKLGPCPICLMHQKPCRCSVEAELKLVDDQLTRLCNMILSLDVVFCPEEIREDGMAILKETEFNELFDYVHRDICKIVG